jgi:two-component system sensor histidine kinase TctE
MIGGTLSLLAAILGIGGSWFIGDIAEGMSDRLLAGSIKALVDGLGVENGAVTLEIPASAFGMLEDSARDNVYYSVRQDSRVLTGYPDFPPSPAAQLPSDDVDFRYARFLGQKVRVATMVRRLPRMKEPVIVEVAETLGDRNALAKRLLAGLIALELILIAVAVLLIWPAMRWGLRPVTSLQRQMQERPFDRIDFTPIPLEGVPGELTGLVSGFNSLLRRLEASVHSMRRFTGDAAHQMRTPLAVLRTHVALLKREAANSSIDDIDEAAERLQRLLTQLLMMARLEEPAALEADRATCDARTVAQDVCRRLAPAAVARDISIEFQADTSFELKLQRLLCEELLTNLVDNAIRYNEPRGVVTVEVRSETEMGLIIIADDGPGIPSTARKKVFDRFYRLERDQAKPGSGLGLPIAEALASMAEATLHLDSRPDGRGLIVTLIFPRESDNV